MVLKTPRQPKGSSKNAKGTQRTQKPTSSDRPKKRSVADREVDPDQEQWSAAERCTMAAETPRGERSGSLPAVELQNRDQPQHGGEE